jgi:hypothetical protein
MAQASEVLTKFFLLKSTQTNPEAHSSSYNSLHYMPLWHAKTHHPFPSKWSFVSKDDREKHAI